MSNPKNYRPILVMTSTYACIKIDTISNLCACLFGQQLTKYPS
jgi:hypothetical protein